LSLSRKYSPSALSFSPSFSVLYKRNYCQKIKLNPNKIPSTCRSHPQRFLVRSRFRFLFLSLSLSPASALRRLAFRIFRRSFREEHKALGWKKAFSQGIGVTVPKARTRDKPINMVLGL
ncbi:hypothetical protein F2P56_011422, partial [Juglans regia]